MPCEVSAGPAEWRSAFRRAVAPLISEAGLVLLRDALAADSPELVQGTTCTPVTTAYHLPCEGACLIAYPLWKERQLATLGDVARAVWEFADRSQEAAGGPEWVHFTSWYDGAPRDEMLAAVLPEVEREIARRADRATAA